MVLCMSVFGDEWVGGVWERWLLLLVDWSYVNFVFSDYVGLMCDLMFIDNLFFLFFEWQFGLNCWVFFMQFFVIFVEYILQKKCVVIVMFNVFGVY